jgi:hypothetical protein
MRRLLALLACSTLARAEIAFDQVRWSPDFGTPHAGLLAGRPEFIYLFHADPAANSGHDKFSWYLHNTYANKVDIAAMIIGVDYNPGVYSDKQPESFARASDDGGLLRAFAGDKPAVMLVCDPTGRLIEMREANQVDDTWLHTLEDYAKKGTPLLDEGSVPGSVRPAMCWYATGDLKRFSAALEKVPNGGAVLKPIAQKAGELADADVQVVTDGSASGTARLLALQQLQALAADFPNVAKDAQKATKAVKDDATIKGELAGWAAFQDYVASARKLKGKGLLEAQKPLLAAVVAKHPSTYGAEVAARIAAFAKIDLPAPK